MNIVPNNSTFGNSVVISDGHQNANLTAAVSAAGETSLVLTPDRVSDIIRHHQGIDIKMQEQLNKRRSILSRLHPSELDKVIEDARLQLFKQSANQMLSINEALHQTHLRQLNALCTANTKGVETMMSAYLIATQGKAYNALLEKMSEIKAETDQCIIRECKSIENIPIPQLKEMRMRELENTMQQTCNIYSSLINRFIATLNSNDINVPNNMFGR
jgi:hypothetical protein